MATKIMEYQLSKSEKKRRAKNIEKLAVELVGLPESDIAGLPCEPFLRQEILTARKLKAGARKRQIKYLTKNLRELDPSPLLDFMAARTGSKLKEKKEFHELENLRDAIITEVLEAARQAEEESEEGLVDRNYPSPALEAALKQFPRLDADSVRQSAMRYSRTRKPALSREIFRQLKAAAERQQWQDRTKDEGE